jgi:3-oxoadipate enol-lactonase
MIGQGFALAYPDRLLSLTLCDTQPSTPPGSAASWDERKDAVRKAGSLKTLADSTMERWFTDEFKKVNPVRWREIRDTISGTTPAGFLGCASAIQNFDYESRLTTIKAPTLVICGDEDPGTPPDRNQLIASKVPGGRYEGIARARHLPNIERPDQFNRVMMSWLAANR